MISFDEFKKLNLVAGKILSAEAHPNADKLLVLKVDIGEETPRTLVAGLKDYYDIGELEGKQVVVVENLEPAKLRGVESRGMLLAAQDGGSVSILIPDKPMSPGAKVL